MKRPSLSFLVFLFLLLAAVVHMVAYYPFLPKQVPSHFGPDGKPNDWASKEALMGTYAAILSLVAVLLSAVALLLPRLPTGLINLPNKDHWLAPERKAETCSALSRYLFWFAAATVALLIACLEITFQVSLGRLRNPNTAFAVVLIVYAAFAVTWCVALLWRFRKAALNAHGFPDSQQQDPR